jgi:hypothetical protein
MLRRFAIVVLALVATLTASAREPLYVVNGEVVATIEGIPQEDIESIDVLPANEETIAEWGLEASEGVILVKLRYDTPARFSAEGYTNFTEYLASKVKWNENMPAERVSLRLTIGTDGRATVSEVLQSTSRQFLKRVEKAIGLSPLWNPATRDGKAVESIVLVNLQLPEGKELPVERAVIIL